MEYNNIIAVMSIVSPIVIVITTFAIYRRQQIRQNKIDSAKLAISIWNTWNQNEKLLKGIKMVLNSDTIMDEHNTPLMTPILNEFEIVAILWRDETLIENHVIEFFSTHIMHIEKNKSLMEHILNVKNIENPKNPVYENLVNLLKHLKE